MNNDDDFLTLCNILKDNKYTDIKDRPPNRKAFFTKDLPKNISEKQNIRSDSDSNLECQGLKNVIPTTIIDIYTRLEVLLGLKRSHRS